ncbi:MAG: LamG domain-containing protein [Candidatus Komeilibacteria bacterium]|nr:LamG domain-containing protein [Candidatus Komeilibacteria bacterium]
MSVWIKSDSLGENEQGRIVDKSDSSFAVNGFALVTIVAGGQNSVLFNIKNTGDIYAPITLGAWQHVLVTVNSAAYASMYINGVFKDGKTQAALSGITTANPLIIGNLFSDGRGYDGRISDLRVYNRALSATEVKNLYKSYDPVVQTNSLDKGLIAHFPLNRAAKQSSTKFADTSPYARIGTITAGASAGLSAELMILTEPIPK